MWSDARTPRQVVALVTAELERRTGTAIRLEARDALAEIALAVQNDRYAPNPQARDLAELDQLVSLVLRELSAPVAVSVPS